LVLLLNFNTNAQFPIPDLINTGSLSLSSSVIPGSFDPNWTVAYGDTLGPTSDFVPALVVDRCDGAWPASSVSNAKWIVYNYGDDCNHIGIGCVDLYFRRIITLPAVNACNVPVENIYCLDMDFLADNCVYDIRINGIKNYQYTKPDYPYKYEGLKIQCHQKCATAGKEVPIRCWYI
jgi:hypothetical protein